jgi:hypothetical protein
MSWWQAKAIYIIIFLGLLQACKNGDEQVSGAIQPKTNNFGAFYTDSFSLNTAIVRYDSVVANSSPTLLIGSYKDDYFGTISADACGKFQLSSYSSNFGPNTVADSIKLAFFVGSTSGSGFSYDSTVIGVGPAYVLGDRIHEQKFGVYRLNQILDDYGNPYYYNTDKINFDATEELGNFKISGSNYTQSVNYTFVKLKTSLAKEFVDNAGSFSSQESFQSFFKGIYIKSDPTNTGLWAINNVFLRFYFHNYYVLNTLPVRDSIDIGLSNINSSKATYSRFSSLNYERSSLANLSSLSSNYVSIQTSKTNSLCYIQNNGGIFTKVEFPTLLAFKNKWNKKIMINRAELVIIPELDDSSSFPIPTNLFAYELNADRTIKKHNYSVAPLNNQTLQNEFYGIFGPFNTQYASYNPSKKSYTFIITSYVQALLDGTKANYGLMLAAANTYSKDLNRILFYNSKQKRNIKLLLYYSAYE